jgi:hypothetical protein
MAKQRRYREDEQENEWSEAQVVVTFKLNRITDYKTPLMEEWLTVEKPLFTATEQEIFDKKYKEVVNKIAGWSEEDLKMKFIVHILELGHLQDENGVIGYFDKTLSATVQGIPLRVKSDFMLAKGFLDLHQNPYFHFQEYKPHKKPTADSMGQLLLAFLIGQAKNQKPLPLYGVEIIGKDWTFITMEGNEYCVSPTYVATVKEDLLQIIAILRKFKQILFERLLD